MKKLSLIDWLKYLPIKIVSFFSLVFFMFSQYFKLKKVEVVFFFPFYHTGGAEIVHTEIIKSVQNVKTYILFTGKSLNNNNKISFNQNSYSYDVYNFLNRNRLIKQLFTNYLTFVINRNKKIKTVFSSNSFFFYSIISRLKNNINKIDLIHAFSYPDAGIELQSLPFAHLLSKRIVINKKTYLDFKNLYIKNNLESYLKNIKIIQNGICFEDYKFKEKKTKEISVGFVGRWSKEKRPELYLKIAQKTQNVNIKFSFIGTDNFKNKSLIEESNVQCLGEIKDRTVLNNNYKKYHFILITSYREGFPVVLMEAMSLGVVPISTNVGGISEHITNNKNGFLISNELDEEIIINNFSKQLLELYKNDERYNSLSMNCYNYARENFGIITFKENYKKVLLGKKL